jgi:protein SCO1/2
MQNTKRLSRRSLFRTLAAGCGSTFLRTQLPAQDHGPVKPPIRAPDISLTLSDGVLTSLLALADHHATAVQVMFTGCSTTCPMQGAIFEQAQKMLSDQRARGIQLLSLSVDPQNDTPEAMTAWLRRFHAGPGWFAAAPQLKDVERVRSFFGRGRSASDNHTTQVQVLNRDGLLVWRTFELPAAEEIARILQRV